MVRLLRHLFRHSPADTGHIPGTVPLHQALASVSWRDPGDPQNPFLFRTLELIHFASSMVVSHDDLQVTRVFHALRTDDGRHHVGRLPNAPLATPCDLRLPLSHPLRFDGNLFRAQVMEEKWDVFRFDDRLYFARSWTGALGFVADCHITPSLLHVRSVSYESQIAAGPPHFIVRQFEFLLKSHILGQLAPAPLPTPVYENPSELAVSLFKLYGRKALFAAPVDSL